MATEDLLVNIDVDTKPAKRGVDDLNASLAENTKQTKAIQKELQRLEKEYKAIATAAKKLPAEQATMLAKEVTKAERATARLSDQFDKTGAKLDKVHDRTVGAATGFAALTAAMTALGNIDTLIKFTDRVNKAAQAVLQFSENVGPTITKTRDLFKKGFEQGGFILANFTNIIKTAGSALTEHRQIMEGYQHVAVGIPRLHAAINDSFRGLASAAKFFERGFVAIRDFSKQTQEGLGRVRTLFNTIVSGSATVMDVLGELGGVFGSTFGSSTGGAARLNVFQRMYLNLQDVIERGGAKISTVFKSITTAAGDFAARGIAAATPLLQNFGTKLIEVAKAGEALAARGFGMLLKGLIDVGVKGLRLGQDMGFLGKGFIGLIDNSAMVGGALVGLGTILKRTDSIVLDTIGSFVQLVGVLSISLSAGLTIVTGLVGQFFLAVGGKLFAISDAWEEKFTAMQKVTQAFEFTLRGFGKTLGEGAVGGLAMWSEQVRSMTETTAFGAAEVQKSIKILVAEGAQLGLTAEQNVTLLKRAGDVAAITGRDLEDVTLSIARGLSGEAGSLKTMGLFVDNASLQHSKLAEQQGLVVDQLSKQAKAQLVVNAIIEQTTPLVGAAADQLDTIAGSQKQLAQTTDLLQAKLGSQSVVWARLTQLQTAFVASLTHLPDGIFDFISATVDALAVVAKLAGAFLTTILTIAGIKGAIETLNLVITQSKVVQIALNTVINVVRVSLGLQAVAITSLRTAMLAVSQTVIPGLIAAFKGFQATLLATSKRVYAFVASLFFTQAGWASIIAGATAATAAVGRFTLALLANPWTYVIGGIVATVVAVQQLAEELDQFKKSNDGLNESVKKTPGFLQQVSTAATNIGQVFVDIAKVVVIGWLKIVRMLELAGVGYQKLWAKITGNTSAMAALDEAQDQIIDKLGELDDALDKTFGGGTAMAAALAGEVGNVALKVKELTSAAQTRFDFGVSGAQVGALGTEFEKATLAIKTASFELSEVQKEAKKVAATFISNKDAADGFVPSPDALNTLIARLKAAGVETKALDDVTSKVSDAFIKKVGAESAALALRNKTAEDAAKASVDAEKSRLEAAGKMIEKIQLETREQIKLLDERKKGLLLLGQDVAVRRDQIVQIEKQRKAIKAQEAAQIQAVKAEELKKQLELRAKEVAEIKRKIDTLDKLNASMKALAVANAEATGDIGAVAQAELEQQLAKIDVLQKQAMAYGPIAKEQQAILDSARELANLKFEEMKPFTVGDLVDTFKKAFDVAKGFAKDLFAGGNPFKDFKLPDLGQLKDIGKNLGKSVKDALMKIDLGKAGSTLWEGFKGGIGFVMDMFNPDNINKVADFFGEFLEKLPDAIGKAFQKLDKVLEKFAEKFPGLLKKLLDALPGIIQSILDKLPAIIDALLKGLADFIDKLPQIFSMIFDALPGIVDQFVKALPGIVLKLFDAIGKIIAKFIQVLPEILKKLIDGFPAFVAAFIEGIIAAMGDIVAAFIDFLIGGGLEKIVGAFLRMIPKLVVAIVQGIARGLARALTSIFSGVKLPSAITDIPAKFSEGIKNLAAKTTEEASKLFKVLDLDAKAKGLDAAKQVEDMANRVLENFNFSFKGLFAWLENIWKWVVDRLTALWSFLKQIWDAVLAILQSLWDFLKAIWDAVITALTALWNTLKSIWDGVIAALTTLWATLKSIWDGLKDKVTEAFKGVAEIFNKLKDTVTGAFKGIQEFFGTTLKDKITNAFKGAVDAVGGLGTKIWNDLKSGLANLGQVFKDALDKINPSNLFSKIFQFDGGGTGTVEKTLGIDVPFASFATGGMVPGTALTSGDSAINDRILALLSPGEAIIPRSKMADPTVKMLVDQILSGQLKPPAFKVGGVVGTVIDTIGGGGGGVGGALGDLWDGLSGGAKSAFGPIASIVNSTLDKAQISSLGQAISEGKVDLKRSPAGQIASYAGSTLGQASTLLKAAGGTISGVGKQALGAATKAINDAKGMLQWVDPKHLWTLVREYAFDSVMKVFEQNAFHTGGLVPGFAGGGEVPSMLQSGEFVINRQAVKSLGLGNLAQLNRGGSMGDQEFNFEVNVNVRSDGMPDESFIRQRMIPAVKKELKDASLRGEFLISEKGIRKT